MRCVLLRLFLILSLNLGFRWHLLDFEGENLLAADCNRYIFYLIFLLDSGNILFFTFSPLIISDNQI